MGSCRKKWACFAQQRCSVSYGILKKEYRGASFRSALVVKSGHASLGKVVLLAIGHTQKKSTGRPRFALQKSWLSLYASIVLKGNSLLSAGIFLCVCDPPPHSSKYNGRREGGGGGVLTPYNPTKEKNTGWPPLARQKSWLR